MSNEGFFKPEMNPAGFSKKALSILSGFDKLIKHYREYSPEVRSLAVWGNDYDTLREQMKKNKQDITNCVYKGFELKAAHK